MLGIFLEEERKFVTFKTEILGGPVIKVTNKVNLQEEYQLGFPHAALSYEFKVYDHWVLCS